MKKKFLILAFVFGIVLAGFCFGTEMVSAKSCEGIETAIEECGDTESGIGHTLSLIISVLSVAIGSASVVGITWAGAQYLTARDNEEQVRKAKRRIYELVLGLALYATFASVLQWMLPNVIDPTQLKHYDIPEVVDVEQPEKKEDEPITYKRVWKEETYRSSKGLRRFTYQLSVPKGATSGMGLVIFMHGDNGGARSFFMNWMDDANKRGKKVITIAPYIPNNDMITSSAFATALRGLIKQLVSEYKISKKDIYMFGHSRGSIMTYAMVNNYGDLFAGVAPMSCSDVNINPKQFRGTKVYIVQGNRDPVCRGWLRSAHKKASLQNAGVDVKLFVPQGRGHGDALADINIDKMLKWLSSNRIK